MAKPKIITRETKTYARGIDVEGDALKKKLNDYESGFQTWLKGEQSQADFGRQQDLKLNPSKQPKPKTAKELANWLDANSPTVKLDLKQKRNEYKDIYNYDEQRKQGLADAEAVRIKEAEGKIAAQLAADEVESKKNEIKGARARQRMQAMGASGRRDTILTGPLGLSMFDDPLTQRNARKTLLGA